MSSFVSYFASPVGFIKVSFALLVFVMLPLLIGTYITKSLVKPCPAENMEAFDKRFEAIKTIVIMFAFIFQITLLILLYKMFDFASVVMNPIFAIPKSVDKSDKIIAWIFVFIALSVFLGTIYGFSLALSKSMTGGGSVGSLDSVYKKHEVFQGAVVIVITCFIVFAGIFAKLYSTRR